MCTVLSCCQNSSVSFHVCLTSLYGSKPMTVCLSSIVFLVFAEADMHQRAVYMYSAVAYEIFSYTWYSRLQKSPQAEQWKTTIDLPCMNFPASVCPTSLFKHNESIVVFHVQLACCKTFAICYRDEPHNMNLPL